MPPVTLERVRELQGRQKQEIMEYENREEKGEEEGAEKKSDIRRGERRSRSNRGRESWATVSTRAQSKSVPT